MKRLIKYFSNKIKLKYPNFKHFLNVVFNVENIYQRINFTSEGQELIRIYYIKISNVAKLLTKVHKNCSFLILFSFHI